MPELALPTLDQLPPPEELQSLWFGAAVAFALLVIGGLLGRGGARAGFAGFFQVLALPAAFVTNSLALRSLAFRDWWDQLDPEWFESLTSGERVSYLVPGAALVALSAWWLRSAERWQRFLQGAAMAGLSFFLMKTWLGQDVGHPSHVGAFEFLGLVGVGLFWWYLHEELAERLRGPSVVFATGLVFSAIGLVFGLYGTALAGRLAGTVGLALMAYALPARWLDRGGFPLAASAGAALVLAAVVYESWYFLPVEPDELPEPRWLALIAMAPFVLFVFRIPLLSRLGLPWRLSLGMLLVMGAIVFGVAALMPGVPPADPYADLYGR